MQPSLACAEVLRSQSRKLGADDIPAVRVVDEYSNYILHQGSAISRSLINRSLGCCSSVSAALSCFAMPPASVNTEAVVT